MKNKHELAMSEDWVEKLKPGDSVIVRYGSCGERRVEVVTRVTKTQVTISDQSTFMKRTHRIRGSYSWDKTEIEEATPILVKNILDQKERMVLVSKLSRYINKASNDQLKRLWAATDEV